MLDRIVPYHSYLTEIEKLIGAYSCINLRPTLLASMEDNVRILLTRSRDTPSTSTPYSESNLSARRSSFSKPFCLVTCQQQDGEAKRAARIAKGDMSVIGGADDNLPRLRSIKDHQPRLQKFLFKLCWHSRSSSLVNIVLET
jgi:hypothetical protein